MTPATTLTRATGRVPDHRRPHGAEADRSVGDSLVMLRSIESSAVRAVMLESVMFRFVMSRCIVVPPNGFRGMPTSLQ